MMKPMMTQGSLAVGRVAAIVTGMFGVRMYHGAAVARLRSPRCRRRAARLGKEVRMQC